TLDQCRKGQLSRLTAAGGEPLEQLAVGERANCADVEESPQLQERFAAVLDRHESSVPVGLPQVSRVNAASGLARSRFVAHSTIFRRGSGAPGTPCDYYGAAHGVEVRPRVPPPPARAVRAQVLATGTPAGRRASRRPRPPRVSRPSSWPAAATRESTRG